MSGPVGGGSYHPPINTKVKQVLFAIFLVTLIVVTSIILLVLAYNLGSLDCNLKHLERSIDLEEYDDEGNAL